MAEKWFGQEVTRVVVWDHRLEMGKIRIVCYYQGTPGLIHNFFEKLSQDVTNFRNEIAYTINGDFYDIVVGILQHNFTETFKVILPYEFLDFTSIKGEFA